MIKGCQAVFLVFQDSSPWFGALEPAICFTGLARNDIVGHIGAWQSGLQTVQLASMFDSWAQHIYGSVLLDPFSGKLHAQTALHEGFASSVCTSKYNTRREILNKGKSRITSRINDGLQSAAGNPVILWIR